MIISLDCYELKEKIGEGTFGTVYSAKDKDSSSPVAIKMVKGCSTWEREFEIHSQTKASGVVPLLTTDIGELETDCGSELSAYGVMPLMPKGDMFTLLQKEGQLNEKVARHFFKQIVKTIDELQMEGIYH